VLTPFPIALSVVCAFATAQTGHVGFLNLLRGIVPGLDGFALFCFLVAITIDRMPAVAAFGIATAAAVGFAIFLVAKPLNHIAPSFLGQG
jgi:Zn-dependent protease